MTGMQEISSKPWSAHMAELTQPVYHDQDCFVYNTHAMALTLGLDDAEVEILRIALLLNHNSDLLKSIEMFMPHYNPERMLEAVSLLTNIPPRPRGTLSSG